MSSSLRRLFHHVPLVGRFTHSLTQQNWVPKWQVLPLGSEDACVSAVCLIYDAGHRGGHAWTQALVMRSGWRTYSLPSWNSLALEGYYITHDICSTAKDKRHRTESKVTPSWLPATSLVIGCWLIQWREEGWHHEIGSGWDGKKPMRPNAMRDIIHMCALSQAWEVTMLLLCARPSIPRSELPDAMLVSIFSPSPWEVRELEVVFHFRLYVSGCALDFFPFPALGFFNYFSFDSRNATSIQQATSQLHLWG